MYHDQGHMPVKLVAGGAAVAMSAAASRSSGRRADHGAAADIAGRGIADARSLSAAIALADRLVS